MISVVFRRFACSAFVPERRSVPQQRNTLCVYIVITICIRTTHPHSINRTTQQHATPTATMATGTKRRRRGGAASPAAAASDDQQQQQQEQQPPAPPPPQTRRTRRTAQAAAAAAVAAEDEYTPAGSGVKQQRPAAAEAAAAAARQQQEEPSDAAAADPQRAGKRRKLSHEAEVVGAQARALQLLLGHVLQGKPMPYFPPEELARLRELGEGLLALVTAAGGAGAAESMAGGAGPVLRGEEKGPDIAEEEDAGADGAGGATTGKRKAPAPAASASSGASAAAAAGGNGGAARRLVEYVPDPIWQHAFGYVPPRDLFAVMCTSTAFFALTRPYQAVYRHWNLRAAEVG